ncbi:TetR/AcrR family transcriptional regulator [Embleya sp. NPDC020630]|uniref:TetR/AcrR family transcriptional regulator n=1 Tax=Embleya sp. NPDC020630 TaxID=3363979 RepID=UPI0037913187
MSAIARAAGVSRVTLYAHFASRESLIEAALDRSVGEAVQVFAEEAADAAPADVAPARLIRSSWRVLDRHSALFAAVSSTLTPDRMREQHERILGPIRRLLLDGQAAGTIRADLPVD